MREIHKFSFEKLEVWNLAKGLVKQIYAMAKKFPAEERFGLVSQMTRATVSVASTIAEGSERVSRKEQAHQHSHQKKHNTDSHRHPYHGLPPL